MNSGAEQELKIVRLHLAYLLGFYQAVSDQHPNLQSDYIDRIKEDFLGSHRHPALKIPVNEPKD